MTRSFDNGRPSELIAILAALPLGRRRVASALLADSCGATYKEVALRLGIHLGSVHAHLRRIRVRHPEVYARLMQERLRQLGRRHELAIARARAHTECWYLSRFPVASVRR